MLLRFIAISAVLFMVGFLLWPWIGQISLSDQITIHAGGHTTHVPLVMGLFGAIGLAAMLLAVKR